MHNNKNYCLLALSLIACLGNALPALSQGADSQEKSPLEVIISTPQPSSSSSSGGCFSELDFEKKLREANKEKPKEERLTEQRIQELLKEKPPLISERVELYYYRNAKNIVSLLAKLPLGAGCSTVLPLNELQAGQGVGRGGGNTILLYGTKGYINNAKRFITSLDLPLPGINLQMWGVQISGKDPNKLAKTTSKVRNRISETQRLLRETFETVQGISQLTFQNQNPLVQVDFPFQNLATQLGYGDAVDGFGGESSILEIFLVGNTVEDPAQFYIDLYDNYLAKGDIVSEIKENDGKRHTYFKAYNQDLQPYFDALKNDTNRPPFERIFRSRGLEPDCIYPPKYEDIKDEEVKCEQWKWKKKPVPNSSPNSNITIVEITSNFEKKVLLEFALYYADFLSNPNEVDPEELQRTADNLNEVLQKSSNLLQKDIEDFFIKPTLSMIQEEVAKDKKLEFAQVGRNTISTLDGVETAVSTSSTSGFQIYQSQNVEQLLTRAETLQGLISNFLPTAALDQATETLTNGSDSSDGSDGSDGSANVSEVAEVAATGVPISRLLGLAVAALEQNSIPIEIQTGNSLAFTPGISRNLNSAELNINLTVVNPTITPTAEEKNVPTISRIGKQELSTTVYTQALDFFELSTFTSQATLDGGRLQVPIIGTIWNAVFNSIPVFGDLFSIPRENQNVLHESLILTNSFITPTPLSLGNLYLPNSSNGFQFCDMRDEILTYLNGFNPPRIGGQISSRNTEIISDRCSKQQNEPK